MFKTICLFAVVALAISQDVSTVTSAVNNAVGSTTLDQAASNVTGTVTSALSGVNLTALPTLNSVTVGSGPREVVVTPQASNPTNNDWLNNGELLNVEHLTGAAAAGEWTLNWSVENGDDYALFNQNGNLVVADYENGTPVVVANLGNNAALDAEIASGAESLVDQAYMSGVTTVNTTDVGQDIDNLVSQVLSQNQAQGFLAQTGNSASSSISSVVNSVSADPSQAASAVQSAVNGSQ